MDETRNSHKRVQSAPQALLLARADVARWMTLADYRASTDETFRVLAVGRTVVSTGVMTASDVYATLPELAVAQKPGRVDHEEITIFDSTGTAIQDAAAAVRIYERAKARRSGSVFDFGRQAQSPVRR